MKYLSIFIRVSLLALGQSLDYHSASEVSLMDMGKSVNVEPQQSTAKQKPCAYFLGYTVYRQVYMYIHRLPSLVIDAPHKPNSALDTYLTMTNFEMNCATISIIVWKK